MMKSNTMKPPDNTSKVYSKSFMIFWQYKKLSLLGILDLLTNIHLFRYKIQTVCNEATNKRKGFIGEKKYALEIEIKF